VAHALKATHPDVQLLALATVSDGHRLADAGCRLLDAGPTLPSGGMTLESPSNLLRDLRGGLLTGLQAQWRALRDFEPDVVVSVGDVWAELLAAVTHTERRVAVQTLVSNRMQGSRPVAGRQVFRERITPIERLLLNRRFEHVFVRDAGTAQWLNAHGVPHAQFAGNAMMDGFTPKSLDGPLAPEVRKKRVVLLPGTRESADANLAFLLDTVARLGPVEAKVAWAKSQPPTTPGVEKGARAATFGQADVVWTGEPFVDLVAWADVAIGSTGTAVEQAAGVGTPVVTFPSPDIRPRFFRNQARLLGDAIALAPRDAPAVARIAQQWLDAPDELKRRAQGGQAVMGPPGAATAIARAALGLDAPGRSPES
jgi:uncharacterized protein (TIGR03492 family)